MVIIDNPLLLHGQNIVQAIVSQNYFQQDVRSVPEEYKTEYTPLYNKLHNNQVTLTHTLMPFEEFSQLWDEFDADKKQPMKEHSEHNVSDEDDVIKGKDNEFDFDIDTYDNAPYRRVLDGKLSNYTVDRSYITDYIENLYRRYCQTAFVEYDTKHKLQVNIIKNDEDEVVYEADETPLFKCETLDMYERISLAQELLMHMKRLFIYGGLCGINYLTFLSAYMRAKHKQEKDRAWAKRNNKSSTYDLSSNRVVDQGYYMADRYGNATTLFTHEQKSDKCEETFKWFTDKKGVKVALSYLMDMNAVVDLCEKLHVDLSNEDMTKFNKEFFDSIVVSTLVPDTQYFATIADKLKTNSAMSKAPSYEEAITRIMNIYYGLLDNNEKFRNREDSFLSPTSKKKNQQAYKDFFEQYNAYCGRQFTVDVSKIHFSNFAYVGDKILQLDISGWFIMDSYKPTIKAICTDLGLVIAITQRDFYYIDIIELYGIIADVYNYGVDGIPKKDRTLWRTLNV